MAQGVQNFSREQLAVGRVPKSLLMQRQALCLGTCSTHEFLELIKLQTVQIGIA